MLAALVHTKVGTILADLFGQQCLLTLLPLLPLNIHNRRLYVVRGGSKEERMISSHCSL